MIGPGCSEEDWRRKEGVARGEGGMADEEGHTLSVPGSRLAWARGLRTCIAVNGDLNLIWSESAGQQQAQQESVGVMFALSSALLAVIDLCHSNSPAVLLPLLLPPSFPSLSTTASMNTGAGDGLGGRNTSSSFLRVISLSIALYDYILTLPAEWRFYRSQRSWRLTFGCILFIAIRYSSIAVITLSNVGYFGSFFSLESCNHYYMAAPIFKGNRPPVLTVWLYYLLSMAYDILTLGISTVYLISFNPKSGKYVDGRASLNVDAPLTYMVTQPLGWPIWFACVNIFNLILYRGEDEATQSSGVSLGYALTWIMSQRILIHLRDAAAAHNRTITTQLVVTHALPSGARSHSAVARAMRSLSYRSRSRSRADNRSRSLAWRHPGSGSGSGSGEDSKRGEMTMTEWTALSTGFDVTDEGDVDWAYGVGSGAREREHEHARRAVRDEEKGEPERNVVAVSMERVSGPERRAGQGRGGCACACSCASAASGSGSGSSGGRTDEKRAPQDEKTTTWSAFSADYDADADEVGEDGEVSDVRVQVEETVTVEVAYDPEALARESYRAPRVLWEVRRGRAVGRAGGGGAGARRKGAARGERGAREGDAGTHECDIIARTTTYDCASLASLLRSLSLSPLLSRSLPSAPVPDPATRLSFLSLSLSLSLSLPAPPPPPPPPRSFVCLKHRNSTPVARRASASVFFTPSRCAWRFSSPGRFAYACEIVVYSAESVWSAGGVTYRESVWCMNSISSVACGACGRGTRCASVSSRRRRRMRREGRTCTYPEHAAHAEALHLAEAAEGLFGDVLDERVERPLEQRRGGRAHLGVDADEEHERLVHVRPDL
ncbi:LOW QUALITY PROTEIN: hypothetical protein ACG7TL_001332 [Trametes sanguinea]